MLGLLLGLCFSLSVWASDFRLVVKPLQETETDIKIGQPFSLYIPGATSLTYTIPDECTFYTDSTTPPPANPEQENPALVVCDTTGVHSFSVTHTVNGVQSTDSFTITAATSPSDYKFALVVYDYGEQYTTDSDGNRNYTQTIVYEGAQNMGPFISLGSYVTLRIWVYRSSYYGENDPNEPIMVADSARLPSAMERTVTETMKRIGLEPQIIVSSELSLVPGQRFTWDEDGKYWEAIMIPAVSGAWQFRISAHRMVDVSYINSQDFTISILDFTPAQCRGDTALLPPWMTPVDTLEGDDTTGGMRHVLDREFGSVGSVLVPVNVPFQTIRASFSELTESRLAAIMQQHVALASPVVDQRLSISNILFVQSMRVLLLPSGEVYVFVEPMELRGALKNLDFPREFFPIDCLDDVVLPGERGYPTGDPFFVPLTEDVRDIYKGAAGGAIGGMLGVLLQLEHMEQLRARVNERSSFIVEYNNGSRVEFAYYHACAAMIRYLRGDHGFFDAEDWQSLGFAHRAPVVMSEVPSGYTLKAFYHPPTPSFFSFGYYTYTEDSGTVCDLIAFQSQVLPLNYSQYKVSPITTSSSASHMSAGCETILGGTDLIFVSLSPEAAEVYAAGDLSIYKIRMNGLAMTVPIHWVDGTEPTGDAFFDGSATANQIGVFTTIQGRCVLVASSVREAVEIPCGTRGLVDITAGASAYLPPVPAVTTHAGSYGSLIVQTQDTLDQPLTSESIMPLSVIDGINNMINWNRIGSCPFTSLKETDTFTSFSQVMDLGSSVDINVTAQTYVCSTQAAADDESDVGTPAYPYRSYREQFEDTQTVSAQISLAIPYQLDNTIRESDAFPDAYLQKSTTGAMIQRYRNLYIYRDLSSTICDVDTQMGFTVGGDAAGSVFHTPFSISLGGMLMSCLVKPSLIQEVNMNELEPMLGSIQDTREDGTGLHPLGALPRSINYDTSFIDTRLGASTLALTTEAKLDWSCPDMRRIFVQGTSFDPADCPDFVEGGKYYRRRPTGATNPADPSVLDHYDFQRFGCPHRVYWADTSGFFLQLEGHDAVGSFDASNVTIAVYELQGRTDFTYSINESQRCTVDAPNWEMANRLNPYRDPWDRFDASIAYPCRERQPDDHKGGHSEARNIPYEIVGEIWENSKWIEGHAKVNQYIYNGIIFPEDGRDGTFLFRARIVDPAFSSCDLYIDFALDVYGAPPSHLIETIILYLCGVLLLVVLLVTSFLLFRAGIVGPGSEGRRKKLRPDRKKAPNEFQLFMQRVGDSFKNFAQN